MKDNTIANLLLIASFFSIFTFFNSCTEEAPSISRGNRIVADSIFRAREIVMKEDIDSLCQLVYKENFDKAVDSISAIRLNEIEKILSVK